MIGKLSLYLGLFFFIIFCRLVWFVQNLVLGKEELIGIMEQIFMNVVIFEDEVFVGVIIYQEFFLYSLLSVIVNFIFFFDYNQSLWNMY